MVAWRDCVSQAAAEGNLSLASHKCIARRGALLFGACPIGPSGRTLPHPGERLTTAPDLTPLRLAAIVAVAAVSGVMNSIAGGGTLLTFPALVALGIPPLVANATSTVALWPGAVGSMWGYRRQLAGVRRWAIGFALPSLVGGGIGAILLERTPPARFDAIVPWLVLGATGLFIAQKPLMRWVARRDSRAPEMDDSQRTSTHPPGWVLAFQLVVSVYGGYFGAGVGILMLAALGFMGLSNIHRMNGLKNWGGLCMNGVAAALFIFGGLVSWPVAIAMAVGATVGGYSGSRLAQRVPQQLVRQAIVAIGLLSGVWLLLAR